MTTVFHTKDEHLKNKGVLRAQIGVKALIYHPQKKKFLCLKANEGSYNPQLSPWELPGGRVDKGEKDLLAVLDREVTEELGAITYEYKGIVDQFIGRSYGDESYAMTVHLLSFIGGHITLSDEHETYKWIDSLEEIGDDKDSRREESFHLARKYIMQIDALEEINQ